MKILNDNLTLKLSNINELEELNNIHSEACVYFSFDKNNIITKPIDCLTVGDLPPGGTVDNFVNLSIYQEDTLIGFMNLYKGYPHKEIAYITFLYISSKNRYRGYGKKIVDNIYTYFKDNGFKSIRVAVSLKNWKSLKFWHCCGFNNITKVSIKGELLDEGYGCIELEKIVSGNKAIKP